MAGDTWEKLRARVRFLEKNPLGVTNTLKLYLAWDVLELKMVEYQESMRERFMYVGLFLHSSRVHTFSVDKKKDIGLDGILVQYNTYTGSYR